MLMHHRLAGMVLADGSLVWGKLSRSSRAWPAVVVPASLCGKSNVLPGRVMLCWLAEYKVSQVPLEKVFNFVGDFTRCLSKTGGKRYMQAVHEGIKEIAARSSTSLTPEGDPIAWATTTFRERGEELAVHSYGPVPVQVRAALSKWRWDVPAAPATQPVQEERTSSSYDFRVPGVVVHHQDECLAAEVEQVYGDKFEGLSRCLCSQCLIRLVDENEPEKVSGSFPWHCHLCSQHRVGQLLPRPDGEAQLLVFFRPRRHWSGSPLPAVADSRRHGLRVLSLFDGIGTGKLVLEKLGLCVEAYFASEVDTDAIRVSISQHGSSVIHLGRVEELDEEKVRSLCPIDLLIAGSPCNDLSLVNPDRKGLYDPLGTGVLFFEFHRILRMVEQLNQGRYLMWMFENVAAMPRLYRGIISRFLQCEPALLDGRFFSPQARARLFWGNIPGMYASLDPQQVQQSAGLDKILDPLLNRRPAVEKIRTVTTNANSLRATKNGVLPVLMGGQRDVLWTTELEEVFGFPKHYTDVGNISLGKRRQLLGKAWSVPVICHILRPLRSFFQLRDGGH
ncbi:DNA (cytosine-5)-methyltransferase 3A-like [Haemaphysalis longicornis]